MVIGIKSNIGEPHMFPKNVSINRVYFTKNEIFTLISTYQVERINCKLS